MAVFEKLLPVAPPGRAFRKKRGVDLRACDAPRRRRFVDALPGRAERGVAPLQRNNQRYDPHIALCPKIACPVVRRIQKCFVVVALGVCDGVLHGGMFTEAEDVNIHRSALEPFAQAAHERLTVTLAEFGNNLRHAIGRKVLRQARDNASLDILSRPAAVPKLDGIDWRWHKWRVRRNQVETFALHRFEQIPCQYFQVGDACGEGVEARALGRARVDIHGEHMAGVG